MKQAKSALLRARCKSSDSHDQANEGRFRSAGQAFGLCLCRTIMTRGQTSSVGLSVVRALGTIKQMTAKGVI